MMNKSDSFIKTRQIFIEQFNGKSLSPSTKSIIDGYNITLKKLKSNAQKLNNFCDSLVPFDEKKFVSRYYARGASVFSTAVVLGTTVGLGMLFGGSNIEVWSPLLVPISASIGAVTGIPSGIAIWKKNVKDFNPKKPGLFLKGTLERKKIKNANKLIVRSQIKENMDMILSGKEPDIHNFSTLSRREQKKYNKIISSIQNNKKSLDTYYDNLVSLRNKNISSRSMKKKTPTEQEQQIADLRLKLEALSRALDRTYTKAEKIIANKNSLASHKKAAINTITLASANFSKMDQIEKRIENNLKELKLKEAEQEFSRLKNIITSICNPLLEILNPHSNITKQNRK